MSEKYKIRDPEGIYFVTPTIVDWVDLFTKPVYPEIILYSLRTSQKEKGLVIHAWCIISSHLHLIASSRKKPLQDIFREFKIFTNGSIVRELQTGNDSRKEWILGIFSSATEKIKRVHNHKVWQDGNHPVQLISNKMIDQRLDYLHNNPVVQGIVRRPEDYVYSSARDYAGEKGLLEIEIIH